MTHLRDVGPSDGRTRYRVLIGSGAAVSQGTTEYRYPAVAPRSSQALSSTAAIAELLGPFDSLVVFTSGCTPHVLQEADAARLAGHIRDWSVIRTSPVHGPSPLVDVRKTISALEDMVTPDRHLQVVVDLTGTDGYMTLVLIAALSFMAARALASIERVVHAVPARTPGQALISDMTDTALLLEWVLCTTALSSPSPVHRLASLFRRFADQLSFSLPSSLRLSHIADTLDHLATQWHPSHTTQPTPDTDTLLTLLTHARTDVGPETPLSLVIAHLIDSLQHDPSPARPEDDHQCSK